MFVVALISNGINQEEMEESLDELLWENNDMFWASLTKVSQEEQKRQVISAELKEWWGKLEKVIGEFPHDALPHDV